MRLMNLVLCLYIILMPRSLCVCVHLGVTFTLIFIINYYYILRSNSVLVPSRAPISPPPVGGRAVRLRALDDLQALRPSALHSLSSLS